MLRVSQRRLRIFGFEPDCGRGALLDRVLRSIPGATAARFGEPFQEACVEFHSETINDRGHRRRY